MYKFFEKLYNHWKITYIPLPKSFVLIKAVFKSSVNDSELGKPWLTSSSDIPHWFSKSRFSIFIVARWWEYFTNKKSPLIWVPDYFCDESLEILRSKKYSIHFYPIKNDLLPDWERCYLDAQVNKPDIFILVHYFGKPSAIKEAREFCNQFQAIFLEDAAHVLMPFDDIGTLSDFVLYSQYKFFTIPDGALLVQRKITKNHWLDHKMDSNKSMTEAMNHLPKKSPDAIGWLMKKVALKLLPDPNWIRKKNKHASGSISNTPFQSGLSRRIIAVEMKSINIISHKRKVYAHILNGFSDDSKFDSLLKSDNYTPYLFGLKLSQNKNIQTKYNKAKLKVISREWPNLPPEIEHNYEGHPIPNQLKKDCLFFPLHHRLNIGVMKIIGNEINKKFNWNFLKNKFDLVWYDGTKEEWVELMNKAQNTSLLQIWDYGISKAKVEGWNVKRGMIMDNDKVKAIFQVLEKSYGPITISRINRGPLIIGEFDYNALFTTFMLIRDHWSWYKGRILFFAPYLFNSPYNMSVLRLAGFLQRNKSKWISSYIDLSLSEEELRKKLNGKWRNQLKKAENSGLEFLVNNSEKNFNTLMQKYEDMMTEKSFKGPNVELYKSMFYQDRDLVFIGLVLFEGNLIAANLISIHDRMCAYEIGWNSKKGRTLYANNFLLWNTIIKLKKQGFSRFDLGGLNELNNPGITKFKRGLTGTEYSLIGEWV